MEISRTIEILEALASGCSPSTGEIIENDSVLNERDVIRALQSAIDKLETHQAQALNVDIDETDIKTTIELFKGEGQNPTSNKLAHFFLGTRKFKNKTLISNKLYSKYRNRYQKGQLLDFFSQYLTDNNLINTNNKKNNPFREIDFFKKEKFNQLSDKAVNQLRQKIEELGVLKTDNLSEYIQNARIHYSRAYESWTDTEKRLLSKAIEHTNDLDLLSECFQRGKGSIESYGQRLIYESQNLQDDENQN